MQSFRSIKKIHLAILNLLLISGVSFANPIGNITEQKGEAKITREAGASLNVTEAQRPDIIMYDTAETVNGRMKIEFLDSEELDLTEHTVVFIDEVYYDPDPSKSKMGLRFVQGTARFASGQGQRIRKEQIDISTPTANITVRGTDFTTTVDELGRTLVILLPDEFGIPSGEIDVSNEGGTITLNEAYQATMVSSYETPPTKAVTINNITPALIDNMFIVNPPVEIREALEEEYRDEINQDQGILDVDFLEFDELEKGYDDYAGGEDLEFNRLDIDYLDVDFLTDLLDVVEALEQTLVKLGDVQTAEAGDANLVGAVLGFNKDSQYNIFQEDGALIFYRDVNGKINIIINDPKGGFIETRADGYEGIIRFGSGEGIEIIINQSN